MKRLEFLDIMLGDRPALTPIKSFYQRILAGDADEAQDQAERLLREHSLSTYYDEVALKGLQLAANDAQRGALDHEQLDRVKSTIRALVHGLERHEDKQPPLSKSDDGAVEPPDDERGLPHNPNPQDISSIQDKVPKAWRSPSAVLCIAGRGPLDEAASAILAQLLGKHGMGHRLLLVAGFSSVRNSAESRGNVGLCAGWRPSAIRCGKEGDQKLRDDIAGLCRPRGRFVEPIRRLRRWQGRSALDCVQADALAPKRQGPTILMRLELIRTR